MVKSKIAELAVGFVVKGASSAMTTVKSAVSYVTSAAKYVAGIGGGFIGGFMAAAARGTMEGQRFAQATEYLARVVGQMFAPYMRAATTVIFRMAQAIRGVDPAIMAQVAKWAILVTGVATFIAFLPVIVAGVTAVAGAFGLLFSPIGLTIVAIGAVMLAAKKMYDFLVGGSASAASDMNSNNRTWIDSLINGIQWAGTQIGNFFNWIAKQWHHLSHNLAIGMGQIAEQNGWVEEGTTANLISDYRHETAKRTDPFNVEQWKRSMGVVRRTIQDLPSLAGILSDITGGANGGGFTMKMKVELEGVQQTYDRLLKAFAEGDGEDLAKQQLNEQKALNGKIDDFMGVVRNGLRDVGIIGP